MSSQLVRSLSIWTRIQAWWALLGIQLRKKEAPTQRVKINLQWVIRDGANKAMKGSRPESWATAQTTKAISNTRARAPWTSLITHRTSSRSTCLYSITTIWATNLKDEAALWGSRPTLHCLGRRTCLLAFTRTIRGIIRRKIAHLISQNQMGGFTPRRTSSRWGTIPVTAT